MSKLIITHGARGKGGTGAATFGGQQVSVESSEKKTLAQKHNPNDDFDHPKIGENSPLRRHVLYRLSKKDWLPN